ncbi:DUF3368 domain-containing protein [Natronosalvus rutilus]|uniref:DUF3368 domain-containing protein n=1 Tax=Natronosalvus rutilus TaxID=2953753 RepID=A0A9E7NA51_9EURY|nr:DUF3368 domain-containing protein [Natronosalvus rutilus]UTF53626.1 DUF3368 domain-containing protein [Natronosalvus rutilus]
MASSEVVVADTSPILNLELIDRTACLRRQFEAITIPSAVRDELLVGQRKREQLETVLESSFVTVESARRTDLVREFRAELDRGESEALALAIDREADLVLIDERDGRQVARRHDLRVTGVVGLLIRAARSDRLSIETALASLREVGFWIDDDLVQRVIDAVEAETGY